MVVNADTSPSVATELGASCRQTSERCIVVARNGSPRIYRHSPQLSLMPATLCLTSPGFGPSSDSDTRRQPATLRDGVFRSDTAGTVA